MWSVLKRLVDAICGLATAVLFMWLIIAFAPDLLKFNTIYWACALGGMFICALAGALVAINAIVSGKPT